KEPFSGSSVPKISGTVGARGDDAPSIGRPGCIRDVVAVLESWDHLLAIGGVPNERVVSFNESQQQGSVRTKARETRRAGVRHAWSERGTRCDIPYTRALVHSCAGRDDFASVGIQLGPNEFRASKGAGVGFIGRHLPNAQGAPGTAHRDALAI